MSNYRQHQRQGDVLKCKSYEELKVELHTLKQRAGDESWSVLWKMVDSYLENSVNTAHPLYLNQLWAGHSDPALIGAVIEVLANTSMYTYEVAPMATVVEDEMCSTFARHLGMQEWASQVTTGGSNSNFIALLLAISRTVPNAASEGIQASVGLRVYVSEDAHYSMDKATMMAGIGQRALVKVPTDERGAMRTDALEERIQQDRKRGLKPCMIVGTAGTTVQGAFDPFNALADIADKTQCWLHVDGAWGGASIYSKTASTHLSGITRANSFSWDTHKMLGVPLMCSLVFVKDKDALANTFNLGNTSYIFHDEDENHDLGPSSLQCGRRVDMFKMWTEYLYYGKAGFEKRIQHFMDLSAMAERRIRSEPDLELQADRWINNICFRVNPATLKDKNRLNEFNETIRSRLKVSGKVLVNKAYLNDALTIRLIITNKDVTEADINQFFDIWLQEARDVQED